MKIKNIFKKNKEGKEVSDGGSRIVRHSEDDECMYYVTEKNFTDTINEYFASKYPLKETLVYSRENNDGFISVNVMCPSTEVEIENDFYVIYTTGMSELAMNMPEELKAEYKHLERAELFATVPAHVPIEEILGGKYFWIIGTIANLAGFAHDYNTWFSHGHTIPNGAEGNPYTEDNQFTGSLLVFDEVVEAEDDVQITMLEMVPLYTEEMNLKLDVGVEKLLIRLSESNYFGIDHSRKNVGI